MLSRNEVTFLQYVLNNPNAIGKKQLTPTIWSLQDRGYLRISKDVTIFRTPTGYHRFKVTEAGREILKGYSN